jgi:hypothetical protein
MKKIMTLAMLFVFGLSFVSCGKTEQIITRKNLQDNYWLGMAAGDKQGYVRGQMLTNSQLEKYAKDKKITLEQAKKQNEALKKDKEEHWEKMNENGRWSKQTRDRVKKENEEIAAKLKKAGLY